MKRFRALTTGMLSIAMMLSASTGVFAAEKVPPITPINNEIMIEEGAAIQHKFESYTGTIKEVRPFYDENEKEVEGKHFVHVEGKEGESDWGVEMVFTIDENTYMLNDNKLEEGKKFIAYYDAAQPMLMIYPPQLTAVAAGVDWEAKSNIKIAYFGEDLISADNDLKLMNVKDAEIILQDGKKFDGDLKNRLLIVFYDVSTRSIPAQTNPSKIVVMFERPEHPIYEMPTGGSLIEGGLDIAEPTPVETNIAKMDIVVDGKAVEGRAYEKSGVTMVPIAPIMSAMGYDAVWDAHTKTITFGRTVSMTVGENAYNFARMAPVTLEYAPEIVDGRTYVPMSFFTKVFQVEGGKVLNGVLEISGKELSTVQ